MSLKSLVIKVGGLLFTLWATASVLFFLGLLLPSAKSPVGMDSTVAVVYGSSTKEIKEHINREFRQRKGLDKPVFYVQLEPYGFNLGNKIQYQSRIRNFNGNASLWHGKEVTEAFLKSWDAFSADSKNDPALRLEADRLATTLAAWAIASSPESKQMLASQFLLDLGKTGQKRADVLENRWRQLLSSRPPFWYFLPSFKWAGLDNQYHVWISGVLTGDLGYSTKDYRPVKDKLMESLQVSAMISLPALTVAVILSVLMGFWLSLPGSPLLKNSFKQALYLLDSLPGFIITLGLFYLFLSAGGTLTSSYGDGIAYFTASNWLASLSVSLFLLPYLTLFFHRGIEQESRNAYLRTAQAKGLTFTRALAMHAVPNALASSVVVVADAFASLIAGVLIVEITFSLPGTGSLLAQSLLSHDFPTALGLTLCLLLLRTVAMWLAELTNEALDPRLRKA